MRHGIKLIFEHMTQKDVRSIVPLDAGITNDNYLINNAFVLRYVPKDVDPTIDRKLEKLVYDKIEPLGISEKLYIFDEKTGIKITRFVHSSRFYKVTPTNEQLIYVSKALKKLHTSSIDVGKGYDLYKKLNFYKKFADKSEYLDQKFEKMVIKEAKIIEENEPIVLCHNDLVVGNLLFKYNGVTIIDREYASMNYEIFDLASFVSENNLSEESTTFFLKKYYGYKYSNLKKKKVESYSRLLDILFYYWAIYYYKKRENRVYFNIAVDKLNRIKNSIMSLKNFY
ncbi:MAG: phosphotransferase [Candidatus Onthovivens sp.]